MSANDPLRLEHPLSLIDSIRQQLGPNEIQQISQQLGVDPATTEQAIQSALPSMVAGMDGNAQQGTGANDIQTAFGGQGGILGGILAGGAGGAGGADFGGMLDSILGRKNDEVQGEVQQKSGLDSAKTRQLLMMLAPIVLAALARRRTQSKESAPPKLDDVRAEEKKSDGGLLGKILAQVQEPRP